MLTIITYITMWLVLGILTVALAEYQNLIDDLTEDVPSSIGTLLLWPLALAILFLAALAWLGRALGERG